MLLLIVIILMTYIIATVLLSRHHKRWPLYRTGFWVLGTICAAIAFVGPLANRAHIDFIAHMLGHLLLGMLAPILIALAVNESCLTSIQCEKSSTSF